MENKLTELEMLKIALSDFEKREIGSNSITDTGFCRYFYLEFKIPINEFYSKFTTLYSIRPKKFYSIKIKRFHIKIKCSYSTYWYRPPGLTGNINDFNPRIKLLRKAIAILENK